MIMNPLLMARIPTEKTSAESHDGDDDDHHDDHDGDDGRLATIEAKRLIFFFPPNRHPSSAQWMKDLPVPRFVVFKFPSHSSFSWFNVCFATPHK